MKKTALLKFFAAFLYITTGILIFSSLCLFLIPSSRLSAQNILIMYFVIFISLSSATFFAVKSCKVRTARKLIVKRSILILFIFYLIILMYLLFLDSYFGRNHMALNSNYYFYLNTSTNLIPFATIIHYINGFRYHTISRPLVITNLVGNLIAFLPMGIFLPVLFRPMKKARIFFLTVTLGIAAIEVTQLLTLTGSCDIDDLILNTIGAAVGFGLIKLLSYKKVPFFS